MDYTPSTPSTREQILAAVLRLKPATAHGLKNGNFDAAVRTGVFDRILEPNGDIITLDYGRDRSYTACYIRVSTEKEGFSATEQAIATINKCIENRWAFSVFSDVGLSGGLPYSHSELIQEFRLHKAEMYEEVFRAVFLQNPTPEDIENIGRMEAYLEAHLNEISNGGYKKLEQVFDMQEGETVPRGRDRKPRWFRPGLTSLVRFMGEKVDGDETYNAQSKGKICRIVITDFSRFSRSDLLNADILPRIKKRKIEMVAVYGQNLDWINGKDMVSGILKEVCTFNASKVRFDILLGVLRGVKQKLSQGMFYATSPFWIVREGDEDGKTLDHQQKSTNKHGKSVFDPVGKRAALRMIELYLSSKDTTSVFVASQLTREGYKSQRGRRISNVSVSNALDNPALLGFQEIFGKWWPVYPALIDIDTWNLIRAKRDARAADHKRRSATFATRNEYLMVGLMKCWCGYNLMADMNNKNLIYYGCRNPNGTVGHARLSQPDVDKFFNGLMHNYAERVVDIVANNSDGEALMEELREMEELNLRNATTRAEKEAELRAKFEPNVVAMVPRNHPTFEQTLRNILDAQPEKIKMVEEEEAEQESVGILRDRLQDTRREEDYSNIKTMLKGWSQLPVLKRNEILKDIFSCLRFEGTPGEERLVPVFKVPTQPDDVFPIEIEAKRCGKGYIRTLEHPQRWMYRMTSKQRGEENDADLQWEEDNTQATDPETRPRFNG